MMRVLFALMVLCCLSDSADALFFRAGAAGPPPTYQGPCDVAPCAEAYSVTRNMTKNYSGNLFQLTRMSDSATLNIGTTNNTVNLSGIQSFCNGTTCVYSKLYSQIPGGTDLSPTSGSVGGITSGLCQTASTLACAPLFYFDPGTGLPIIPTMYPTQMYNPAVDANVIGGGNPTSVFFYTRNEFHSTCCGLFGPAHSFAQADIDGTDFLPALGLGTGNNYVNCSAATTICSMTDIETYATNGADYLPTANQDVAVLHVFTGGSSTNLINVYVNSPTAIYSGPPAHSTTLNIGRYIRLGGGGDGSHVATAFREGLITNTALTPADFTNLNGNLTAFYGGRSPPACRSTVDVGYYQSNSDGTALQNASIGSTLAGYGLRRMSASYFGPIADLTDSETTPVTHTYGAVGCKLDPAGATFCAANPPCHVSKLYFQGTYSSQNVSNAHDALLDMTAVGAAQPTVDFTGLNGIPTMVFSGAQTMCTSTLGGNNSYFSLLGAVAKRTANPTGYGTVLEIGGTNSGFGFGNAGGQIYASLGGALTSGGSLTESSWHSINWETIGTGGNQSAVYGDGVSLGTGGNGFPLIGTTPWCIGGSGGGTNYLTGEIAEVTVGVNGAPGAAGTATQQAVLFALQQAAWGTL